MSAHSKLPGKTVAYLLPALVVGAVAWFALRPSGPRLVEVGDSAPDFDLPLTASSPVKSATGSIRLADYRGHVLVLNFWGSWCPPCVEETPSLEDFAEKVRPLGVVVIGASECYDCSKSDEDPGLAAFISKYHITYPIARDASRALATRYGTLQFPETYIIDRDGRLAEKIISNTDWDDPRMLEFVRDLAQPNRQQASD